MEIACFFFLVQFLVRCHARKSDTDSSEGCWWLRGLPSAWKTWVQLSALLQSFLPHLHLLEKVQ